jgi:AcrR family transcriptional regulator
MARKTEASADNGPAVDPRKAGVTALLALAAERDWDEISLTDIAARAEITLSQLRGAFPSKGAILAAYAREVDQFVLDGIDAGMENEPARERLFDVLMRRIDALAPHKAAMKSIMKGLRRDPLALVAINQMLVNSMRWMLVAASIDAEGPLGTARAQGLAVAWSRILNVWLDDEDEGLARTMSTVDKELRSGEFWIRRAEDLWNFTSPFRHMAERSTGRRPHLADRLRSRVEKILSRGDRMMRRRRPADQDDVEAS